MDRKPNSTSNPNTSARYRARYDLDTKELRFRLSQRVEPLLRRAKILREAEAAGLRNQGEYLHYAGLGLPDVMRLKAEFGIDVYNLKTPEDKARLRCIIERDFPHLKTTNKRVFIR